MKKAKILLGSLMVSMMIISCGIPEKIDVSSSKSSENSTNTNSATENNNTNSETPIAQKYLVLGWYNKPATSGLTEEIIGNFKTALNNYLRAEGASNESLSNVVIRGYEGKVAEMGAAINKDGDVDVLLGVGGNIDTDAGVTVKEKIGNISMGGKKRYIARLTDNEVGQKVYAWFQSEAAQTSLAVPGSGESSLDPKPNDSSSEEPIEQKYLVLGWYNAEVSGLTEAIIVNFETALKAYLKSEGATEMELKSIVIRAYSGDVATMGSAVNKDGDVDILIGVGKNITSTGTVETKEKIGDIPMGGKKRYIARLTDNEIGVKVYTWLQGEVAQASLAPSA